MIQPNEAFDLNNMEGHFPSSIWQSLPSVSLQRSQDARPDPLNGAKGDIGTNRTA
tara:strand:- start:4343 stop:4507 length:165 start_codon:yes stop_codon:yes gene_type:complete